MSISDGFGVQERQSLLSKLLDAVKQCQIRFGGRTELATENDSRVVCLCAQFEAVLQHGIRKTNKSFLPLRHVTGMMKGLNILNNEAEPVFWQIVRLVLNKHEFERYMLLKNITTDIGRGRAWLRSALNEHSLERYMHMILADSAQIKNFYEDGAFLLDDERSSMLPMMAAGLGSILFAISIDNPDLNLVRTSNTESPVDSTKYSPPKEEFEPRPVISKSVENGLVKKKKKKKRPTSQVVSFDDDDLCDENIKTLDLLPESCSAPATCLSSPVQVSGNFLEFSSTSSLKKSSIDYTSVTNTCEGNMNIKDSLSSPEVCNENTVKNNLDYSVQSIVRAASCPLAVLNNNSVVVTDCSDNGANEIGSPSGIGSPPTLCVLPDNSEPGNSEQTTLTPIGDSSVGELIPIVHNEEGAASDDSVSIPSFCEDVDNAVAALAVAQRLPSWSVSSNNSQGSTKSEPRSRSDTLTMSPDEMREALLSVMQKKEEFEEKNNALRCLLEREMEMAAGLRAEVEEQKKSSEEKVERLEAKLQTVSRENELLKHQLKKYIAAVQLLKHDSGKVQELTSVVGEVQPPIPEPKVFIDHQFEASEYEKKLVQVAEMHGELMEFNERLHRLLLQRETAIRRLKEELIDLRGPLPDDNQTSDDDISITSDYDASSQTATLRPLINVWIPSAFLTGKSADVHHVYQVYVRIRDDEWNVYRRYAQFYALHKILKKRDPIVNTFDFPPKKTIGKKDAKVVEQRRRRLQHYLRCVLNWLLQTNADISNSPDKETFISLLPFFSDQVNTQKKQSRNSRARQSDNSCLNPEQSATPHYTGL
ncbi:sorting nexin-29-like isoform X2 [Argiope bruennichi]|uniref:Sorting nexin-29 like protein n=1 Tax=Argiope bruennichi TaxID=94029 RepID=A0A8T0EL89_ARGBR|nr:sorting nexin-29-like isoform X2 [Argiope bruennichi]KAF8774174.1 Sorting nexin-29 like protein [Argiope bruennichi]